MAKTKANRVVGIAPSIDRDWQAEDDLRTLTRAEEIKADPKRMKAAQMLAKEKLAELAAISSGAK